LRRRQRPRGHTIALDTEKIARYLECAEWNLERAIKVGDYRATQTHAQVSIAESNLILVALSLAAKDDGDATQESSLRSHRAPRAPVWSHGNCPVNHRSEETAKRCANRERR
jgi:hypothetical protein